MAEFLYPTQVIRRKRAGAGWTVVGEYGDAMIRQLDHGGVPRGKRFELEVAPLDDEGMPAVYLTMAATDVLIGVFGHIRLTGFVADDEESFSPDYSLEEWAVTIRSAEARKSEETT